MTGQQELDESGGYGRAPSVSITSPFLLTEDPTIAQQIAALGQPRRYRAGQFVYRQGSLSDYFFQVVRGRLRIYLTRADGTERVLSYAEPGAGIGESTCFDGLPRYASCVAMVDSELLAVSKRAVLDAGRLEPEILVEMTRRISRKARLFAMHIAADGLPACGRVALILDHLVEAYGIPCPEGVRLRVQYSLDELALMIGVTRVTMSRELARLIDDGLVIRRGREIVVPDVAALRVVAGDYRP
ncbi:Crp/Fnr family transcriptional regulator [Pseudonocardia halophobica]|uniref:CarD family transcriptional regulator n=1 Tax=Pseudonocardia halophobica TaxID=29401 RepID=A0A9W6NYE7_9PSEU|nr:Crp/Fnr family transcriptional regulator [Pseudonocardia halophobica]GLL14440.1 CarD family transcriptional regulator [Pseudonocardia halophobica]